MLKTKARYLFIPMLALVLGLTFTASAQSPELIVGQPVFAEINTETPSVAFTYTLSQLSYVTFQAFSESVHPTITIIHNDDTVAHHTNVNGELAVELVAVLNPGTYTVEIGSANAASSNVLVVVLGETPVSIQAIVPGVGVTGTLSPEQPAAMYDFTALPETAYLYIDSDSVDEGVTVRLINTDQMVTTATFSAEILGVRLRIPTGDSTYQLEIARSSSESDISFTVCFISVSEGACQSTAEAPATDDVVAVPAGDGCFITPTTASGTNIRQTADQNAPVLLVLPAGAIANVVGIAPGGTYYQITYASVTGWAAAIAVTADGNCDTVSIVNPPPLAAAPPPSPAPTDSAPPPPPPPAISPTPSGPCLITITDPTYVYVIPDSDIANLYDQTMAGYELIPTGRLVDNSWWSTNYGPSWIETTHFGMTAIVTGDCGGLPVVSP